MGSFETEDDIQQWLSDNVWNERAPDFLFEQQKNPKFERELQQVQIALQKIINSKYTSTTDKVVGWGGSVSSVGGLGVLVFGAVPPVGTALTIGGAMVSVVQYARARKRKKEIEKLEGWVPELERISRKRNKLYKLEI